MFCLILLILFFSRRFYWLGYGYPYSYSPYGTRYRGGYGYGELPYAYGAYSYYNPYSPYNRMYGDSYGYYRPYGYW